MAVTKVRKKDLGRVSNYQGVINETLMQPYRIDCDPHPIVTTEAEIRAALPQYLSQHPDNPLMTVRQININQSLSWHQYEAEIHYSSEPLTDEEKERENEPNPTLRRARVEWESADFMLPIYRDINGEPTLNSAGDYPDPPIEIEVSRWVVSVEKDVNSIPAWIMTHRNVINLAAFTIRGVSIPAEVAKLSGLRISDIKSEGDYEYFTLSYQLHLATVLEETWKLKMLDQGLHEIETVDGVDVKKPIKIDDEDAKQPVLLDGSGSAILNPTPADAIYLDYEGYPKISFADLPGIDGA